MTTVQYTNTSPDTKETTQQSPYAPENEPGEPDRTSQFSPTNPDERLHREHVDETHTGNDNQHSPTLPSSSVTYGLVITEGPCLLHRRYGTNGNVCHLTCPGREPLGLADLY